MPGWLQPVVQLTTTLGLPTVFAGVLLWFVLSRVGTAMERIEHNEVLRTQLLTAIQTSFIQAIDRQTIAFEQAIARQTVAFEAAIEENVKVNRELAERHRGPRAEPK
jgi:hypothetical protein